METLYADASVSIAELKNDPAFVIEHAEGLPIAVLDHDRPTAYLVPAETFAAIMEQLEDMELAQIVRERADESSVRVSLDDL
jgi:antitoxin StbD